MFPFFISRVIAQEDINFAHHVSFDRYLVFFHEARIAYFAKLGYDFDRGDEIGMIVAEAHCFYKKELRLGDVVKIHCRSREIKEKAVVMEFLITMDDQECAEGSLTALCFDYGSQNVKPFPENVSKEMKAFEGMPS